MSAAPILETLRRRGVTIRREGDRLKLRSESGAVPADVVELARKHKPELLAGMPDAAEVAIQRVRLIAAADGEDVARSLIEHLPDAELEGVELLSDAGLSSYARMIEADADRTQGRVPRGWTQAGRCRRCGPVALWPGAPLDVLGCPWCVPRSRGVTIPRPAITCLTCAHWRPAADNPDGGIGDCAQGEERRNPHQQHTCAAWTPEASP